MTTAQQKSILDLVLQYAEKHGFDGELATSEALFQSDNMQIEGLELVGDILDALENVKGMPAGKNAPQSEAKDCQATRLASPSCCARYSNDGSKPNDGPIRLVSDCEVDVQVRLTPQEYRQRVDGIVPRLLGLLSGNSRSKSSHSLAESAVLGGSAQ